MSTERGLRRRQEIVEVAAAILREEGPAAISHRSVARRVGCSLSATTYYFDGLDDLLGEAGRVNIARWASRAEAVAEDVEASPVPTSRAAEIEIVLAAGLPADEEPLGHYLQLVAAGTAEPVARAYRTGRHRLNGAISRVLKHVGSSSSAELVIAVIDGAAVSALSEGRDIRETAHAMLDQVL